MFPSPELFVILSHELTKLINLNYAFLTQLVFPSWHVTRFRLTRTHPDSSFSADHII